MKYNYLAVLLLVAIYAIQVESDGTSDATNSESSGSQVELDDEQRRAVRVFFELQGVDILDDAIKRYSPNIIKLMAGVVRDREQSREKPVHSYSVNDFIYREELKKAGLSRKPGVELETAEFDVWLKAIDLIVPDSWSDSMLNKYKIELNEFHKDKPELAKELLRKFYEHLYYVPETETYIKSLRHMYYHWIPLSSLADYVEKNSQD